MQEHGYKIIPVNPRYAGDQRNWVDSIAQTVLLQQSFLQFAVFVLMLVCRCA